MRKITAIVCLLLPACGAPSSATTLREERLDVPAAPVAIAPPTASFVGSPAGSSSSASSSSSSSSSGAASEAYGGGSCVFGVAGAIQAWVDTPTNFTEAIPTGHVSCGGVVDGVTHQLDFDLGQLVGPGAYVATGAAYDRYYADGSGSHAQDVYGAATATCLVTLTTAPVGVVEGAPLVGTFRCDVLAEDTTESSSTAPAGSVAIYEGSIDAATWFPLD